ncbi:MAG: hypothetical protein L3J05_00825 [Robiginitomaculum sp.]|nr:hypothetical protein [Robiginitomaculum sp.]
MSRLPFLVCDTVKTMHNCLSKKIDKIYGYSIANDASVQNAFKMGRLIRQLREGYNFNQNLRIRAWVLACARRRAWVRSVIGEAAITRWQHKYDVLSGVAPRPAISAPKPKENPWQQANKAQNKPPKPTDQKQDKQFALPNLSEMFFKPATEVPSIYVQDPLYKIAPVFWPRPARVLTPPVFWPHELTDDYIPPNHRKPHKNTDADTNKHSYAPQPPPHQNKQIPLSNDVPTDSRDPPF